MMIRGALLGAVFLGMAASAIGQGDRAPTSKTRIKSSQRCSEGTAMGNLRGRLQKSPIPTGDGITPWPRLYGAWVNTDRGIVAVIRGEESDNRGLVRVRLYHLCTSSLMAEGSRFIEKSDYKSEALTLRLESKNNALPYPWFDASFTVMFDRLGRPSYVDTQILSSEVNDRRMSDHFKLFQP